MKISNIYNHPSPCSESSYVLNLAYIYIVALLLTILYILIPSIIFFEKINKLRVIILDR